MTAYYPSQASYGHHAQPAVVYPSSAGYGQSYGGGYGQSAGGVIVPQVMPSMAAPMVMAPSHGHGHPHYSFGSRMRRFFGLAPRNGVRYKSDRGTWGFMGYSRRQRYVDARTGGEVDRQGRPVYRV
ncbi:hypothetical protein B0H34DRAFT_671270 [Crassisporium funariophilum]|nr:hypothetical protein B0H34DRAFT_671270 [Crassisporium funariophilum]